MGNPSVNGHENPNVDTSLDGRIPFANKHRGSAPLSESAALPR